MRYLITYKENGIHQCFSTLWFTTNNFNKNVEMMVIDLQKNKYTIDGEDWLEIPEDHL